MIAIFNLRGLGAYAGVSQPCVLQVIHTLPPKAKRCVERLERHANPRAPSVRRLLNDERAVPAVVNFLRDTEVGRMITLASPPENVPFPFPFFCLFLRLNLLRRDWGKGPTMTRGTTVAWRISRLGYTCKNHRSALG